MGVFDRIAGAFSGAAARVEAIARALRGPEASKIATIPGVPHFSPTDPDEKTRRALESWSIYASRVAPEAGPSRTRWALWPADALTPATILDAQRSAVTSGIPHVWVELIDQVYSRDGHYASVTDQRVADVIKGSWRLTRAAADDAGTVTRNFAAECYNNCSRWRDGLGWLLYANLYGYTGVEIEWGEERVTFAGPCGEPIGPIEAAVPKKLHAVHPKHFRFDLESDDPRFWIGNSYQPLPIGKFIFLDGAGLHPIKARHGHAWQCVWYSLFRSIGWSGWAVFVERFGMPIPMIEYEGGIAQYAEYKTAYQDILNSLGTGKGAIYPSDAARFRIEASPAGGRASDPHSALSDACDAGQSIRVLGATLTTKIGNVGSFAASTTHAEVKYALEESDAGRLWERIDEQLTAPLILFNAPAIASALQAAGYDITPDMLIRRIPRGKHRVPRESDPMVEMQVADIAVNKLNLPLSQEGMLDRIDFPRAIDDSDRVKGEPQVVGAGAALVANAEAADGAAKNPDVAAEAKAAEPPAKPEAPKSEKAPAAMSRVAFNTGWEESKHQRDDDGKFGPGGGGAAPKSDEPDDDEPPEEKPPKWAPAKTKPIERKMTPEGKSLPGASPGSQLPDDVRERLRSLGVTKFPAAHIGEVHISDRVGDDNAVHEGAVLKWTDDKGKVQSSYTPEFDRRNAEQKWQRVLANRPRVSAALDEMREKAQKSPAHAAALVIAETGLRPGSDESVKKHGHYGITTLEARHVKIDDQVAHLDFIGKEGVRNQTTITDPATVAALRRNVEGKRPTERVFAASRDAIASAVPEGVKLKDLRTTQAANIAEAALSSQSITIDPPPTKQHAKAVAKILKEMSTAVAARLNNTPAMARRSYIPPQIIQAWAEKNGVPKEWIA